MSRNTALVASLALFRSLYQSKKGDILSIVSLYILSAVKKVSPDKFTEEQIATWLDTYFNIVVPGAVIKQALIKNQDLYKWTKSGYELQKIANDVDVSSFEDEVNDSAAKCEKIIDSFYDYVSTNRGGKDITETEKGKLRESFLSYVMDKDNTDVNSPTTKVIAQYIIENESNDQFIELINNIREGLIIYEGMKYEDACNEHSWKKDTVLFLDVQYLFSAFGFNSNYCKSCFDEFYRLVELINSSIPVRPGGKKRITLSYFQETKDVIDKFFTKAQRIKNGSDSYSPESEAMTKIVNQCEDDSAVLLLKAKFYEFLRTKHIEICQDHPDLLDNKDYLFETDLLEKKIEKEFLKEDVDDAKKLIPIADYVNIFRQGKTTKKWEDCGYFFVSDSNISTQLSSMLRANDEQAATPVFLKMDWFTQKMWLVTNQPIVNDNSVTFNVLYRAKLLVSILCQDSVTKAYKQLQEKDEKDSTLKAFYQELRASDYSVDSTNADNVRQRLELASGDALQIFLDAKKRAEEKDVLQQKQINELTKQIHSRDIDDEVNEIFQRKYGLWLDHYRPVSFFVAAILILVMFLLFANKMLVCGFIIGAIALLVAISSFLNITKRFISQKREQIVKNIRKECKTNQQSTI